MAENKYKHVLGDLVLVAADGNSSTVIYQGDLMKVSGTQVIQMATSTDNLAFHGVSMSYKPSTGAHKDDKVIVAETRSPGEFEFDLNTATTVNVGDKLAASVLTAGAMKLAKTATNAIFAATESKTSASKIRCRMLQTQAYEVGNLS